MLLRAGFVQAGAIKPANVKRDGALLPALHKARPDESEAERLQLLTLDPRGEPAVGGQLEIPLGLGGRDPGMHPAYPGEHSDAGVTRPRRERCCLASAHPRTLIP